MLILKHVAVEVAFICHQSQSGTYLHAVFHIALCVGSHRKQHHQEYQCLSHIGGYYYLVMAEGLLSDVLVECPFHTLPFPPQNIHTLSWLSVAMVKALLLSKLAGRL